MPEQGLRSQLTRDEAQKCQRDRHDPRQPSARRSLGLSGHLHQWRGLDIHEASL
jgi:hypothetical protein